MKFILILLITGACQVLPEIAEVVGEAAVEEVVQVEMTHHNKHGDVDFALDMKHEVPVSEEQK